MGQFSYPTIGDILKDNGVKTYKETGDGLVAIHKRNTTGDGYYWKYYKFYALSDYPAGGGDGYYYTGSTRRFEA